MSKEPDRFVRRAILTIVLGISTGVVSVWRQFLHPDMTWARCWIEHPWHQAVPTAMLVATLVAFWWTHRGDR